jgi:hypothetical protein
VTEYFMVIPSIHQPWTDRCLASCRLLPGRIIVVDNSRINHGVAAAWNVGARKVLNEKADWLIVCSASIRFGEPGGQDFIDALDANPEAVAVEAAHGIGWHLIAFNRRALETVGLFDENFYPGYYEDFDYGHRIARGFNLSEPYWLKVSVDVAMAGFRHGVDLGGAHVPIDRLIAYMKRKWGGTNGPDGMWDNPFNDPSLPLSYWPPFQGPAGS